MNTFATNSLGCKVNQYESQQIRELLESLGLVQVKTFNDRPDLVVINTCCVTRSASAKSRQYIRKAQKLSPDAVVVVSGCLPAVEIGEMDDLGKNVRLIRQRDCLAARLAQIVRGEGPAADSRSLQTNQDTIIKSKNRRKIKVKNKLVDEPELPQLKVFKGRVRAFLKIQDGCDGFCSYCIIPKARSIVRSKAAEAVLEEAQSLVKSGHKEIVLTGIFLGAYGQQSVRRSNWEKGQNGQLADLLDEMAAIRGLARIRLSSLEPGDVTPRLLGTFGKHRNIMPHLHLSLQSGSDAVLRRMRRQYSVGEFVRAVELIRSRVDRPAVTADIIVGFPGETDADSEATVRLAEEVGFAKMHVFGFSARAGTPAANMQGLVDNRVIKRRTEILRQLDGKLGREFREEFVGEECEILVEDGGFKGRSERYFMVCVEKRGVDLRRGELVRVRLVENREDGVVGRVVTEAAG
ncbi:MAG: tRNA (N(6)-L-threonylcarbamoyladenosine(37)-C(2))-methylthiotransferase MtaB [Planctomycetota bacterium]|jgi:threonylcarbamoyladenosine tRNA methylthiotransferase MtaB